MPQKGTVAGVSFAGYISNYKVFQTFFSKIEAI